MGQAAFAFDAPTATRSALERFVDHLPHHPSCGDEKPAYLIRTKSIAVKYDYIQANPPHLIAWLTFDLDHDHLSMPNPWIWHDKNLPAPNIIVRSRDTNKAHISYAIKPVATGENAHKHPQRYLKAIRKALAKKLEADEDYTGRITKNPLSDEWITTVLHHREYELGELADSVELTNEPLWKKATDLMASGRNCMVFNRLRYWAYEHVAAARERGTYADWEDQLLSLALRQNSFTGSQFASRGKLATKEVAHIAKSVAKFTWDKYRTTKGIMELPKHLPLENRQRLSARRTHELRSNESEKAITDAIRELKATGKKVSKTAVANLTKLSRQQISARYGHLFTGQEAATGAAHSVNYGVDQITAPFRVVASDVFKEAPMTQDKHDNHSITPANSLSGGVAAKPNAFASLCKTLHCMEKVAASDGVSLPQFNFETRGRLARVIMSQRLPWEVSESLATAIVAFAAESRYQHMSIDNWCGYVVAAGKSYRSLPTVSKSHKLIEFQRFLRGEKFNLKDEDLKDLAEYMRSVL